MKILPLLVSGFLTLCCCLSPLTTSLRAEPIPPAPREGDATQQEKWMKLHNDFVARAKQGGIDILLLGDSITHRWPASAWEENFAPLVAARFGIEGDQIQHLHWRLLNGELDGIKPKVVVMLIGSNNVPRPFTPDQVADSTQAIVELIRSKSPETKVLILGVLPRNEEASNIMRDRIRLINLLTAKLDNGETVRCLDLSTKVTDSTGKILRETLPDFLHPSSACYAVLIKSISPLVLQMAGKK